MIEQIRIFFRSTAGQYVAVGLVIAALLVMVWSIRSFGTSEAVDLSRSRMYIDATTGKPFRHTIDLTDRVPITAPSGQKTGYPAEMCYWTKDGKSVQEPHYVLLNEYKRPPEKGPTFCPQCGRLVTPMNPPAIPGEKAPPTRAEFKPEDLRR